MKSFKTYVTTICMEEYGHLVLLALFDCVDDTKLTQKIIIEVRNMFYHHINFVYLLFYKNIIYYYGGLFRIEVFLLIDSFLERKLIIIQMCDMKHINCNVRHF